MSIWKKLFGGKKPNTGCEKCGGSFEWPTSYKSGPIPIPSHIVDKAIYCPICRKKFCIKCVRGKCPVCGSAEFTYVPARGSADDSNQGNAPSPATEEADRGKHHGSRSQAYLAAVTAYAELKDKARGVEMSDFMRRSLFTTLQKKIPSEIHSMCEEVRGAMARGEKDIKAFISELETREIYGDIDKL
jgi:hypothetical protein